MVSFYAFWDYELCLLAVLRFGRMFLLRVMSLGEGSLVKMPNKDKMKDYQAAIAARNPIFSHLHGVSDGIKLYLEKSGDCVIQNMFL